MTQVTEGDNRRMSVSNYSVGGPKKRVWPILGDVVL